MLTSASVQRHSLGLKNIITTQLKAWINTTNTKGLEDTRDIQAHYPSKKLPPVLIWSLEKSASALSLTMANIQVRSLHWCWSILQWQAVWWCKSYLKCLNLLELTLLNVPTMLESVKLHMVQSSNTRGLSTAQLQWQCKLLLATTWKDIRCPSKVLVNWTWANGARTLYYVLNNNVE